MSVTEHLGFVLQGGLKDAVFVNGCIATRTGQYFIVGVNDGQKTAAILLLTFSVLRPAHTSKHMLTVYHRATDIHTRGIDAADEFTIQGENLETALFTRRANQYGIVRVAVIHHYTVSTYQVMFFILIVSSAKLADKLSAAVELQNIIRAISLSLIHI